MNVVKYEEDSTEMDFSANELLTSFETPSTSSSAYGTPEPKLNLLDGTFFSYLAEKSTANKIVALCMICRPRHVEVRGYGNCSSNFLSHLKRRHGEETVADYKNYIRCKKSRCLKHVEENFKTSSLSVAAAAAAAGAATTGTKAATIGTGVATTGTGTATSVAARISDPLSMSIPMTNGTDSLVQAQSNNLYNEQLDESIFRFFISAMIPPSATENPHFAQMLDLLSPMNRNMGLQMITHQGLEKRIKENFAIYMADIKSKLSEMTNVCTTLHIWLGDKEHFVGVSAHWITQDLKRFSTPLACRSIKRRNYNAFRMSQLIREINEDFGISAEKLVGTVTGNACDFVRAFNIFGVQLTNITMNEELDLEDCILFDADDIKSSNENEHKNESLNIVPLDADVSPLKLKCCSIVLISAITDAISEELNYSNNTVLSNIHATTINKCNILWQAAGNPKLAEVMENHVFMKLKRPNFVNWTSLNVSLHQILAIKDKNITLHKALNLQNPFSDNEFVYLYEYLTCTAPIVEALEILQSNQNTFYGIVMPCIFALRRNLMKVAEKTQFYYCKNLINSYMAHVTCSFNDYFDLNSETAQNAAFAALSFPRFKNQWLVCVTPAQRNEILNAFKLIVSKEVKTKWLKNELSQPSEKDNRENNFFNFEADFESENPKSNIQHTLDVPFRKAEAHILQFFAEDSTDLSILYSYPEIKRVFLKYNTLLPSLVTGERQFHLPTMNELRRNHKAFNELLEKRIILNAHLNLNQFSY